MQGNNKNNKIAILILTILFVSILAALIYFLTNKNDRIVEAERPKPSFPIVETIYNAITGNNNSEATTTATATTTIDDFVELKYLIKVYDKNSAGEVAYAQTVKASTSTEEDRVIINALALDRETGFIYKRTDEDNYAVQKTLSNTDFTNILSAEFTPNGEFVAVLYKNGAGETEGYIGKVPQSENTNLINKGIVVGVKNFRASTDSKSFIYQKMVSGGSEIYRFDLVKNTEQLLFSIPLREITLNYNNLDQITISTKPTYIENQKTFIYNIKSKRLSFYLETPGSININNPNLAYIYSSGLNISKSFGAAQTKTLADKCASDNTSSYFICGVPKSRPSGSYPDDWYMGKTSFQDNITLLNPNNAYEESVLDIQKEVGENVDVYDVKINDGLAIFKNKINNNVFLMDLSSFLEGNSLGE